MSWEVIDNEYNRHWCPELIGLRFPIPPSYVGVKEVPELPNSAQYIEALKWLYWNSCKSQKSTK